MADSTVARSGARCAHLGEQGSSHPSPVHADRRSDIAAGPDAAEERSLSAAIERPTAPSWWQLFAATFCGGNFSQQLFAVLGVFGD